MKPGRPLVAASAVDRMALATMLLASAWFVFAAAWGMFGIPTAGHLGAGSAATVMSSEPMLLWKVAYPSWAWYTGAPPLKDVYICHHPFGTYYLSALFVWIFGHHDFVVHLPTVLMSAAIPPLLYGIARERWGAPVGAVAAAAYVVVPIAIGFSNYTNLETMCIFGTLLFFWGHSRHMTTGRSRYLLASLTGLVFVCAADWVGYLIVAPLIAWAFVRAFVLPARFSPRFWFEAYARWWGLSVGIVAGLLILWLGMFDAVDQLGAWLLQGTARGGGQLVSLDAVLQSRKDWIDFSFTPWAIFLGKLAAPVGLIRLFALRRDEEAYAPSLLFGAGIQYVAFKNGADVHIFWPHYFAPYYALGLAQLVHTIAAGVGWVARRFAPAQAAVLAGTAALTIGLVPSIAMAHDGVLSLWIWRRTGGRYDEKGHLIRSQFDMHEVVAQVVVPATVRGTPIDTHESAGWGWDHIWNYQGQGSPAGQPSSGNAGAHPFWLARGTGMSADLEKKIAVSAHVRIYGDVWLVDQREPVAPVDAYATNEREPNAVEWLLLGGTERLRTVSRQPDPWLTWEWRTHLGQSARHPIGAPKTLDEMRIAHNVAVADGDDTQAKLWESRIGAQLDRAVTARFEQGVSLIGVRVLGGVEPRIEAWFEVSAPIGDLVFDVTSTIEARSRWSVVPADTTDRQMAYPPTLATKLWRPGFLYKTETTMNPRLGRERYSGQWVSRDGSPAPRRIDGTDPTTLTVAD
jgi:4-amino-4-deoxy-L-arabinose transferase-like glycosyltransferase